MCGELLLVVASCGFNPASALDASKPPIDAADDASDASHELLDAPADWWNPAFKARRLITVDNPTVATTLSAFPVLVALTQGSNDNLLGANSSDVAFIGSDDATVLPYDVDTGSAAGALFWVSIDITPGTPAPTFYVYFGDTGSAGPSPNAPAVWAAYVSVHHLGGDFIDVTGHGHDGAPLSQSTTPQAVAGQIGNAAMFGGSAAMDSVPLNGSNGYDLTTSLSISVWIRVASWQSTFECIVCKGDTAWRVHRGDGTSHADFGSTPLVGGTGGNNNLDSSVNVDDNQWHLLGVEFDGSNKAISVDGAAPATTPSGTLATNTLQVDIGRNTNASSPPPDRYFDGLIDELRIGPTLRGSAWFATEVRAVTDASFVTLGPIETLP